eukprot:366559-Chlamydomonas_euryale.AAC.7
MPTPVSAAIARQPPRTTRRPKTQACSARERRARGETIPSWRDQADLAHERRMKRRPISPAPRNLLAGSTAPWHAPCMALALPSPALPERTCHSPQPAPPDRAG